MHKQSKARTFLTGPVRAMAGTFRRFAHERRGGVAIPFALTAIPLSFLALGAMDFHRATMIKTGLQDSLDAAALAVGRSTLTDPTQIQALGSNMLSADLKRKVLWDNAVDLYRFPPGTLPG